MERQLEAHGQRRRQAMGEPFALPPATQDALLAEVKRQYPPEAASSARFNWLAWWPKLAWTGAIAGALLLVLAPLVQRTASVAHVASDRYGEFDLAQAPAIQPAAPAAEKDELAKKENSMRLMRDKSPLENKLRLEEERIQAGSDVRLELWTAEAKSAANQPAVSDVPVPARAPRPAPASEAMKRRYGLTPMADVEPTNTALARGLFAAGKSLSVTTASASAEVRFGTSLMATNGFFEAASNAAILNSFQLIQNGQEIQIQDEDGSVYSGKIVSAKEMGQISKGANPVAAEPQKPAQRAFGVRGGGEPETNLTLYFRLAGTNLSLKQNVEIEGALANASTFNQTAGGLTAGASVWNYSITNPAAFTISGQAELNRAGQVRSDNNLNANRLKFQNALSPLNNRAAQNANYLNSNQAKDQRSQIRLQGQAIVGGTNQVPIDAYPNSP